MRLLSMSDTFSATTSDTRNPAPYATLHAALYKPRRRIEKTRDFLWAQDDRKLAWHVDELVWFTMSARPSVILKKVAVSRRFG